MVRNRSPQSDPPDPRNTVDHRRHPRKALPVGYVQVRVRLSGQQRFSLTGHAYDISLSGIRFELDQPLPLGKSIDMQLCLPGNEPPDHPICAKARCVRLHDDDETGPVRMGARFIDLPKPTDQRQLAAYLSE
ncbi:MAG: PilZ domain-containing protein [Phycisphaerales bacterium]